MTYFNIRCLQDCISRFQPIIPALTSIAESLHSDSLAVLIGLYDQCYPLLEQAMWVSTSDFDELLDCYQALYREQDALIQRLGDDRHYFILSIPVADRPAHLQTCLESIYQVCESFGYGGKASGVYQRIKIVVAEDSREESNIQRHVELVNEYRQKGLQVFHLGQMEQYELLHSLPEQQRLQLGNILTTLPRERFYLKGQAANRNLSYLKCLQLSEEKNKTLYYMVDSDQSFCINRLTEDGEQAVFALNYFYVIDKIFRTTETLMLTGKVVGDPPVSPSVMTANFLDDVIAFFSSMAETYGEVSCGFHGASDKTPGDAAYHDMANLFGFNNHNLIFPYRCRLDGEHDHVACMQEFCGRLSGFFFGEHLTRKTYFSYSDGFMRLTPARTVYPGNYIVNYEGLKYVIPFGQLRLRMSGPTAGRLIAAEIKHRFASVNLPHLHRRISAAGLSEDFRPGVELVQDSEQQFIDLSDEYERQFFGDLMLFTTESLLKITDINSPFPASLVLDVMQQKEGELLDIYLQKHQAILYKIKKLKSLVFDQSNWWLQVRELDKAMVQISVFINNIQLNYGDKSVAWQQIQSTEHRSHRKRQIEEALVNYRSERDAWDGLF